ncbi:MAG TPA: ATP-dependent DNA ligase [Nitrososphaeria archaeon]|nr:ATP-dependent DNA ligase [Nitrososphaeria archaeon]
MAETKFKELAEVCEKLVILSGRKDKISQVARFLKKLDLEEAPAAALLLIGRALPEGSERRLEVSFATIMDLLGDSSQSLLSSEEPPTILEVSSTLKRIAEISGPSSRSRKIALLRSLIMRMSELERKWLFKQIIGEMQHGVNEGVLLEALAELTGADLKSVQRAYMLLGRLDELVRIAKEGGREAIQKVRLKIFNPLRPMLAEICNDIDELLKNIGEPMAFEYKFDGARVQIHMKDGVVKIYSRRLNEVTESIPDIVKQVKDGVKDAKEIVLDGEVIAVDKDGKPLPFQELLRRFRRIRGVFEKIEEIPLKLQVFDILYLDGIELLDKPYEERWRILSEKVDPKLLAPRIITSDPKAVKDFLKKAVEEGHEGLMAKRLNSPYRPGRREKLWLKIKPAENLDLVIVAADWGYGRRTGWLSNYHLAAYNPRTDDFEVVGKTFKGLTDEEFELMTKRLLQLKLSDDGYTVRVKPEIVVEVAYNEIQRSPKYRSGYALRFARITRIRSDKSPREADTIDKIRELYLKQFRRKGSLTEEFLSDHR